MSDPTQVPLPVSPVMVGGHVPESLPSMGSQSRQQASYDQAAYKMELDSRRLELLEEAVIRLTQVVHSNEVANQQSRNSQDYEKRVNIRIVLPPFHGTANENVISWIARIENAFDGEKLYDESRRISLAVNALQDAAFEWYRAQLRTRIYTSWVQFTNDLKRAFLPPNHQHIFRRHLKSCKQSGSVQDYVFRFRSVLGQIESMDDLDQVENFVAGLKLQTAQEVEYRCPETLDEAIAIAISFDSARFGPNHKRIHGRSPSGNRSGAGPSHYRRDSHSLPSPMKLDAISTARQNDIKNRLCFKCHRPGHISRDCRRNQPLSGNDRE